MTIEKLGPFRLAPWFSERPWGRANLKPWFEETGKSGPVGEAWLNGPESEIETGPLAGKAFAAAVTQNSAAIVGADGAEFPLLVKLLFPNDKLSVQVHPDDTHAQAMGQPRGKTECWYVLEAEPGAAIALGLKQGASEEVVRKAIADGTLEDWVESVPVNVGDMVFVDAGTVHAIGPGVVLLETQQTSDTTFRMYDYGRPRELHVEQALQVMRAKTDAGKVAPKQMQEGFMRLIEQKYFTVDRYDVAAGDEVSLDGGVPTCLAGLRGTARVESSEGETVELKPGHAVVVPVSVGHVDIRTDAGLSFVRCFAPMV
jgi:mannose-6-phosphate isomerase